jgi:hypothetical protein
MLFYKINSHDQNKMQEDEITQEYKSGMMDPCREAAQVEKQAAVKKTIVKKHHK